MRVAVVSSKSENTKQTIHFRKEDGNMCGVRLKDFVELVELLNNEGKEHEISYFVLTR